MPKDMPDPLIPRHSLLLVSITRELKNRKSVYDAARFSWRVDRKRVEKVELVLACVKGVVEDAFVPEKWLNATEENFPDIKAGPGGPKWGFEGVRADEEVRLHYVGKSVPEKLKIGQLGFRYFG